MADKRCPACYGTDLKTTLTVTATQAAQHFVLKEQMPERHDQLVEHIRSLWQQDHCNIQACAECGSGFATPFVAGDARFYNLAYPRVEHPKQKWEFRHTAEVLQRLDTLGKSALEIGAGYGSFLDLVCPRFFAAEDVMALEYNGVAVDRLRAKGYTAFPTDLHDATLDKYRNMISFIFAFQVVEHMDRLDEVFARLNFLSAPDASVFIAVPNKIRTDFQESSGSLIDMPPNHIGRWSPRALDVLASRHGFVPRRQATEVFDVPEFLRHDLTYTYLRRAQRSGSVANRIRSISAGRLRQILELGFAASLLPSRIARWRHAYPLISTLGASSWVHLSKV